MRILLVTHAPLRPEFGAAQAAIHLAAALRGRGHDALAWSTEPLPAAARSWSSWWWQRRRIEDYLAANPPFDLLDLPAVSISRAIAAHPRVVARSVQPDLLYFGAALGAQLRHPRWASLRFAVHLPTLGLVSGAILQGWRRAGLILCLGTHETDWMRRRFPWTREKLETYVDAIAPADQEIFAGIRHSRGRGTSAGPEMPRPLSFLWIGRWVPQKGTDLLLRFLAERSRTHPEDRFTLAGCGPQAERECPPELIRNGRLRLVPSFPRSALPRLLEEHDAGLFTSVVEGWGLSLNEMLESGLPVFATRAGGTADLAPYFPTTLRPFPPPPDVDLHGLSGPPEDLAANGYFARFTWASVAREYEERVIARLP